MYGNELAFIHYLFKSDLGGTAFYRHRATGYEYIDEARRPGIRRIVDEEEAGPTPAMPDTSTGIHRCTSESTTRTASSTEC